MKLSLNETRVIGVLVEKELTTPDQYPLTLNALTLACNQKTNRDPILNLSEASVKATLEDLTTKHLVVSRNQHTGRAIRYQHRFYNTEFGELQFTAAEIAVICTLLLRGPQTAGELRTRASRLHEFANLAETEKVLEDLSQHEKGPFVSRLAREPGKRECRYVHLFSNQDDVIAAAQAVASDSAAATDTVQVSTTHKHDHINALEEQLQRLQQELSTLQDRVTQLEKKS